jgi:hypothetical protein
MNWAVFDLSVEPLPDQSSDYTHFAVFQDECGSQRPFRDAWFAVGLTDKAAFMQVLSNSALHFDTLRNGRKPQETQLSLYYQLRTVRSLNKRRQDEDRFLSNGSIGAVSMLMCHDVGCCFCRDLHPSNVCRALLDPSKVGPIIARGLQT